MPTHLVEATNYSADWINAWLAAIGITVAVEGVRLYWSQDPVPCARFESAYADLPAVVYERLPAAEYLAKLPIARQLEGRADFPRKVTLDAFRDRVDLEREAPESALAISVTDLVAPRSKARPEDGLHHSAFDVTVPKGITLWQRANACRQAVTCPSMVAQSLCGHPPRVKTNGLGFDVRRIPSRSDGGDNYVDPVVELLAFLGLSLFPVRADARRVRTRGWSSSAKERGAFRWAAWRLPRDRWSIDAWLDRFHANLGTDVGPVFQSVPYRPVGASDTTRGYASEPVP